MTNRHRSRITISLSAIWNNVHVLRDRLRGAELFAVVKGDAYGHGAVDVSRVALEAGAAALCVATVGEAIQLRAALPEARIIVLGHTHESGIEAASEHRVELTIGDRRTYDRVPGNVPVHLKLNTGLNRWGFDAMPAMRPNVVGVMSHFAPTAGLPREGPAQLAQFLRMTSEAVQVTRHIANSVALLTLPEAQLDAVRTGALVVGLSPLNDDPRCYGLRPAMRWTSYIGQVRRLRAGDAVGYARGWVAPVDCRVAIVPVGYADGFMRAATGSEVCVRGTSCPVIGPVSMDAMAVLLLGPGEPDDEVVIVGDDILMEQHARAANTMSLEFAANIRSTATRTERLPIK